MTMLETAPVVDESQYEPRHAVVGAHAILESEPTEGYEARHKEAGVTETESADSEAEVDGVDHEESAVEPEEATEENETEANTDAAVVESVKRTKAEARDNIAPVIQRAGQRLAELIDNTSVNRLVRAIEDNHPQAAGAVQQLDQLLGSAGSRLSDTDAWEVLRYATFIDNFVEEYGQQLPGAKVAQDDIIAVTGAVNAGIEGVINSDLRVVRRDLSGLVQGEDTAMAIGATARDLVETNIAAVNATAQRLSASMTDLATVPTNLNGDDSNALNQAPVPRPLQELTYQLKVVASRIANGEKTLAYQALQRLGELVPYIARIGAVGQNLIQEDAKIRNTLQDVSDALQLIARSSPLFQE